MNFVTSLGRKTNGQLPLIAPQGSPSPGRAQRMTVTPELAEQWLRNNTHNRKLSETHALAYASDMEAGRWKYNYVPIIIASDGTLIDGQHRLMACTLARVPFVSDVVFGADVLGTIRAFL
jgi:hypothetical protein